MTAFFIAANWWMIAAISAGPVPAGSAGGEMSVRQVKDTGQVEVSRGGEPVLRYNFATVPVPAALKGKKYAEARSDYIHPLYGPGGEVLTVDYANDHPHHRGVYWAWPEVYYKGQVRDLHALQGAFARPVKLLSASAEAEISFAGRAKSP